MDPIEKRLHRVEAYLFGNGAPGADEELRALLARDKEVQQMLKEWTDTKSQMAGARKAVIIAAVVVSLLGGSLGTAILVTLRQVAAALP